MLPLKVGQYDQSESLAYFHRSRSFWRFDPSKDVSNVSLPHRHLSTTNQRGAVTTTERWHPHDNSQINQVSSLSPPPCSTIRQGGESREVDKETIQSVSKKYS